MAKEQLQRIFEIFARLIGIGIIAVGILLVGSSPVLGIPLVGVGLLFALKPSIAAELLDLAASLV